MLADGPALWLDNTEVVMRSVGIGVAILIGLTHAAWSAPDATVDRDQLRKELIAQREVNLKRFHDYRRAGVYPHNSYQEGFLNVWRDDDDHLCAVATLVSMQGLHGLVASVASEQNFVKIADLASGPLIDWVLTSGLTQEEVAMIQYPNFAEVDPVGYARMMREERKREREERRRERARKREDQRLAAGYLATERTLKEERVRDAGLDVAVARLAARPDLVAALHARALAGP